MKAIFKWIILIAVFVGVGFFVCSYINNKESLKNKKALLALSPKLGVPYNQGCRIDQFEIRNVEKKKLQSGSNQISGIIRILSVDKKKLSTPVDFQDFPHFF